MYSWVSSIEYDPSLFWVIGSIFVPLISSLSIVKLFDVAGAPSDPQWIVILYIPLTSLPSPSILSL